MDWNAIRDAVLPPPVPPPECPPGWTTGPPDFVGIGAQRAGTTRWHGLVREHPHVVRGPKELHFFDSYWCRPNLDLDRYQLYFPRPPGSISGEWTPRYMFDHWTPSLLAQAAPNTKLLVSLRDPVDRYVSGLVKHSRQQRKGQPITDATPADTMHRGAYRAQLRHVLRHFDRGQLLVLQFERCVAAPDPELRRTFEFLGLDPELRKPACTGGEIGSRELYPLPDHERRALVERYEEDVAALATEFPEIDLALWPNFRHLA
jgi:hypothetical protein